MANEQCKAGHELIAKAWALLDELEKVRSAPVGDSDWSALNKADDELRSVLDGVEDAPASAAGPSDWELLAEWDRVSTIAKAGERRLAVMRAVLAKWGAASTAQAAHAAQGDAEQSKLIQQMLEALETCRESGYVDIDGDWQQSQHFDRAAVDVAIDAARSQSKEGGA